MAYARIPTVQKSVRPWVENYSWVEIIVKAQCVLRKGGDEGIVKLGHGTM